MADDPWNEGKKTLVLTSLFSRPNKTSKDYPDAQDFNEPTDTRLEILTRLATKFEKSERDLEQFLWAVAHIMPEERLKSLEGGIDPELKRVEEFAGKKAEVLLTWMQKFPSKNHPQSCTDPATGKRTPVTPRSRMARRIATDRDEACILTGQSTREVAHIVPACLLRSEDDTDRTAAQTNLYEFIKYIADAGDGTEWAAKIEQLRRNPNDKILQATNLICLSPDAHQLWNNGIFALKPLPGNDDAREMRVQFFWQHRENNKEGDAHFFRRITDKPGSTRDYIPQRHHMSTKRGFRSTDESRDLKSGDILIIRTDDPDGKPLPCRRLLQLQWLMTRMLALAGAAGPALYDILNNDYEAPMVEGDTFNDGSQSPMLLDEAADDNYKSLDSDGYVDLPLLSHQPAYEGHTFFLSTGDYGIANTPGYGGFCEGNGCVDQHLKNPLAYNGTIFSPQFPAKCPYVLAVGATQLTSGQSVKDPEGVLQRTPVACGSTSLQFSSGGGFSNYFPRPSYQNASVTTYLAKHNPGHMYYTANNVDASNQTTNIGKNGGVYNRGGRAYPDVSANGANLTAPYDGKLGAFFGTSLSTPLWASIITMINAERAAIGRKPVGMVQPVLYEHLAAFHDITHGSNPGCGTNGFPAVPGWDPSSGLGNVPVYGDIVASADISKGTPNYSALLRIFKALP